MISCIEWVPRGIADPNPKRYELSKAERELLEQDADGTDTNEETMVEDDAVAEDVDGDDDDDDDVAEDGKGSENKPKTASEIVAENQIDPNTLPPELRMDDYSDDEDANGGEATGIGNLLIGSESAPLGIDENGILEDEANVNEENDIDSDDSDDDDDDFDEDDLANIPDTREFMTTDVTGLEAMCFTGMDGTGELEDEVDDDNSDVDDTNLKPDDAMIIIAKTEEDFAALEVMVYEEKTGNLFVHHDIPLPSYPLCLSHGTVNSEGSAGNYVAVGTFDTGIEVWNADVLNVLEPSMVLGGEDTSEADAQWQRSISGSKGAGGRARPSMNSRNGLRKGSHTDAVMALSWNGIHRQVIASGSADNTVKLWDVTKADDASCGVAATFAHHTDKVQSVEWHPSEGSILATGSYDRTVALVDARSSSSCKKVKIPADCEAIAWDPHQPQFLTAASEDGTVSCWDVRKFATGDKYWSFVAHEYGGCSDISYNRNIPGMLVTCAVDKTVALWDTQNAGNGTNPFACGNKNMNSGKLYSVSFYPSSPWLLGCAGSGNQLALWNLFSEDVFQLRFGERLEGKSNGIDAAENEKNSSNVSAEPNFEAVMAASDAASEDIKKTGGKKKKGKGKSKKGKAHKKR